jgi:peptide-methionine (S)-S-oxide reductase
MSTFFQRIFRAVAPLSVLPAEPAPPLPANAKLATFAAGCFWGVEHAYRRRFPALLSARVGYIGGASASPSYRDVCTGSTGHAEALQVAFDPAAEGAPTYRDLVEFFFRMHDPTTKDRQGPDRGTQYRSAIFVHDDEQEREAREVRDLVQKQWWKEGQIVTEIVRAGEWWDAEAYHQKYLDHNPGGYECPSQ